MRMGGLDRFLVPAAFLCFAARPATSQIAVNPANMARIGTVEDRFQAYNVEMLEVTGGRFWKPYKDLQSLPGQIGAARESGATPAGMDPNLYEYRAPIDLSNTRLRKLAAALGPSYVRVSGTWANTTYFQDAEGSAPASPPPGFNGVLTQKQWKGVIDFSHAVDARIITSFATSAGTRDSNGVWTSDQARHFLSYTKANGGDIAAAEFMNEPNIAAMGGAPKGYDAAAYARDIAVFRPFLKQVAPTILFVGPGSVAEGGPRLLPPGGGFIPSDQLLQSTGGVLDVFSYHLYAAVSQRCANQGAGMQTTAEAALSDDWLARPDKINAYYGALRDRFEPGKPLWITETADAACGGNPWASTFVDVFRYLDSHARLAQQGVRVVAHNTLAASDYGLLDEKTFAPRPDYWAALLWKKLMGTTVLNPGASPKPNLRLYAHCLRDMPGGVTLLAINTDRDIAQKIEISSDAQRYTLTAPKLDAVQVDLNGKELKLGPDDSIPVLAAETSRPGPVMLPPASITFLAVATANNASCR